MPKRLTRRQFAKLHTHATWPRELVVSLLGGLLYLLLSQYYGWDQDVRPEMGMILAGCLAAVVFPIGEYAIHWARAEWVQDRQEVRALRTLLPIDVQVYSAWSTPIQSPSGPCWAIELHNARVTNKSLTEPVSLDFAMSIGVTSKNGPRYEIWERYLQGLHEDTRFSKHLRGPLNIPPGESRGGTIAFTILPGNLGLPGETVLLDLNDIILTVTDHVASKTLTIKLSDSSIPKTLEIKVPAASEGRQLPKRDPPGQPPSRE